jgi:hypothetical protein
MADYDDVLHLFCLQRPRYDFRIRLGRGCWVIAGQIDRNHAMPARLELGGQAIPAPSPMPGAVDEGEVHYGRPSFLLHRIRCPSFMSLSFVAG